jgi:NOL1/NOP2/fmu family ribosome biogenesis protein
MKYNNAILGFAKLMGNRMNNAYPKEWRIRSEEK